MLAQLAKLEEKHDRSDLVGNLLVLSSSFSTLFYNLSLKFLLIAGFFSIFYCFSVCLIPENNSVRVFILE